MNIDIWMTIIGLGGASFAIRLSGYLLASQIPQDGMWARALQALPGGVDDVSGLLPGRSGAAARLDALLDSVGARDEQQAVVVAADGYTTPPVPVSAIRSGLTGEMVRFSRSLVKW